MRSDYYVYILRDPRKNNSPFYIGKGTGDRANSHLWQSKKNAENPWKHNKIASIREAGLEPIVDYCKTGLTESEAYDLEAELIKLYGRAKIDPAGILTNICSDLRPPDPTGRPCTPETRKKIGDPQRGDKNHRFGKSWSDAEKKTRSEFNKKNGIKPPNRFGPMPIEQRNAIRLGNSGKKRTAEQIEKLKKARFKPRRDLSGERFGEWLVLCAAADRIAPCGVKKRFWVCECAACGTTRREVEEGNLKREISRSCGCTHRRGPTSGTC